MKILLVEDELSLLQEMTEFFQNLRYTVESVSTYETASEKIALYNYDCMVVDLMLPDGNGLDLISQVRRLSLPLCIIVVSACGTTEEKIVGLDTGADDYISKPFSLSELNSRIHAVLRRRCMSGQNSIKIDKLRLYPDAHKAFVGDDLLPLTPKEFDMLVYFVTNRGRVLSKESIVEHLWGDSMGITADSFDFIYTHIRNLRYKMNKAGIGNYIQTVYSVGYRFDVSNED